VNILLLAPHPFYANRGTPIAVRFVCEGLVGLGHSVDVLTYHVGEDLDIPGVSISRIRRPPFVGSVPIGPSWQKFVCDVYMAFALRRMLRTTRYDLVHAVEESAFLAARLELPFVFDMDSLMSRQLTEKSPLLWPAARVFAMLERHALRRCAGVLAVCESLAREARKQQGNVHLLPDVAMAGHGPGALSAEVTAAAGVKLMYVGNLQRYQGVDLMLQAFAAAAADYPQAALIVVGGSPGDIAACRRKAEALGVARQVRFAGPAPVETLGRVLEHADILVSPRIKGENTPMKLYSYLLSGKPVLATRLPTHTQVVSDANAVLTEPTVASMADGMRRLLGSPELRTRLGAAGRNLAEESYSLEAFRRRLGDFYRTVAR
jgi:glycosyltransferase involved in cell wall biosynthesis